MTHRTFVIVVAFATTPLAAQELPAATESAQIATANGISAQLNSDALPKVVAVYKLHGDKALSPEAMSDDGQRVYISWGKDQPIPAVFVVNSAGSEEMVDGYMRADIFTIDRINAVLRFRIDKAELTARRLVTAGAGK